MAEQRYSDFRMNEAFNDGTFIAIEELRPNEPDAEDREWFDTEYPFWGDRFTQTEQDEMSREDVANALDEQINWPHR